MDPVTAPPARSGLVTVIAWAGIISGGFGLLAALPLLARPTPTGIALLLGAAGSLVTSLGLRSRREWARQGFIYVLVCTALMGLVGAYRVRMPSLEDFSAGATTAPTVTQEQLDAMAADLRPLLLPGAIAAAVINVLLAAYVSSRRVRREFDPESGA